MSADASVHVTGVGLLCPLGRDYGDVISALKAGRSAIRRMAEWGALGLRSQVAAPTAPELKERFVDRIPKNTRMAMSDTGLLCSLAAIDALNDAGLTPSDLNSVRSACIVGSSVASTHAVYDGVRKIHEGAVRRISPYTVLRAMCSSVSTTVVGAIGFRGRSYSLASACATSAHAIGHAYELIRSGRIDVAIAGGGDELNEHVAAAFDALRMALSTRYNDRPGTASRPFDAGRDGFVLGSGAGIVVLESRQHIERRKARSRARVAGFAANTGPDDLVLPDREGLPGRDCIRFALEDAGVAPEEIGAVNVHGTGTIAGDVAEVNALRQVFGARVPPFSSTKSMTGHALGGAGALEIIFCVGMLENQCLLPSINIETVDPLFADMPIVRKAESANLEYVLKNSFGFGGTNASLILQKSDG